MSCTTRKLKTRFKLHLRRIGVTMKYVKMHREMDGWSIKLNPLITGITPAMLGANNSQQTATEASIDGDDPALD